MAIRIGIIDSGVKTSHPLFKDKKIEGYSLYCNEDGTISKTFDFEDEIGHGTAIYYLISRSVGNAEIINIKIYSKNSSIDSNNFENILEYIYNTEKFDYINISMGIVNYGCVERLNRICKKFIDSGTCIISAFDNNGAVSFPAALDCVIGVDTTNDINVSKNDYICIKNNMVNLLSKRVMIRVPWVNPDYILVQGSSFLCAEVTGKLASKGLKKIDDICNKKIVYKKPKNITLNYEIKKAAVFPFNKEIHSLARFHDLLKFEIVDFYSSRITGQVNKKINEIIENCCLDKTIKDIDYIDWNSFDTLIIGHVKEITKIINIDYAKLLITEAIKQNKNIYTFDDYYEITNNYKNYFSPIINNNFINKRYGKLYKINTPVISIIGTNSKQGKFTLQLHLRKKFLEAGYKVGQLGTEPSSLLFGMDQIFHCGYGSFVDMHNYEISSIINQMIWDIAQKDVDIIIVGCQSGLLAYNDYNISMLPFQHQVIFETIQSDGIILCINSFDSVDFVERVIKFAEGLSGGKVIGLVCYPLDFTDSWMSSFGAKKRISNDFENQLKKIYLEKLNKNVYMLDKDEEIKNLFNDCIEYFQG